MNDTLRSFGTLFDALVANVSSQDFDTSSPLLLADRLLLNAPNVDKSMQDFILAPYINKVDHGPDIGPKTRTFVSLGTSHRVPFLGTASLRFQQYWLITK